MINVAPEKPKAIVVTHLFGALAPMPEIMKVATKHGIQVLEDCAQSLGATLGGKHGGTFGDIATTSFYPTKNLGAIGDGGAVFTASDDLAETVRRMRQYGWKTKYDIQFRHGKNSRLDEMQAAILRVKLPYLDRNNNRRRAHHDEYASGAGDYVSMVNSSSESFVAHLAVCVSKDPKSVREKLAKHGVATDVHYPIPDYKQKFPEFTSVTSDLEVTDWAATSIVSLPMFPELTSGEISDVTRALQFL